MYKPQDNIPPEYRGVVKEVSVSVGTEPLFKVYNPIDGEYVTTVFSLGVAIDIVDTYNSQWTQKEMKPLIDRGTICTGGLR